MKFDKIPELVLSACMWANLPSESKTINYANLNEFLWVSLPDEFTTNFVISTISEKSKSGYHHIPADTYVREGYYPWVHILKSGLNLEIGYHIYRITLVNTISDDLFSLYFAYTIQNDDPEKPYYYMPQVNE